MEQKHLPDENLKQWAESLRAHNLGDFAAVLLNYAGVWGYIGGQILWMLTPFFGDSNLKELAELMEDTKALQKLRDYLVS